MCAASRWSAIVGGYFGPIEQGQALLQPLRSAFPPAVDLFGPMPYIQFQSLIDEPNAAGLRYYWRSNYYDNLTDDWIETVIAHVARMPPGPTSFNSHQLRGAAARVGEDETAVGHRQAAYAFNITAVWEHPQDDERHIQWVRDFSKALQPFATGGVYVNFLSDEGDARVRAAFGDAQVRPAGGAQE